MRLGSISLLAKLSQKDIISLASKTEVLDCTIAKEF